MKIPKTIIATVVVVSLLGGGVVFAEANSLPEPVEEKVEVVEQKPEEPIEKPKEELKEDYAKIDGSLGDPSRRGVHNTGEEYVEIDGGSGGRSAFSCYNPDTPRKPGENEVLVKGSMYGNSNGGYVCADPAHIKEVCSVAYSNPCMNGTYNLDNSWLLSIGVDLNKIKENVVEYTTFTPVDTP